MRDKKKVLRCFTRDVCEGRKEDERRSKRKVLTVYKQHTHSLERKIHVEMTSQNENFRGVSCLDE